MYRFKTRRKAFTLAEVLIAVAIIGIVAALVLPSLLYDLEMRGWNTSADVFEKKLQQNLSVMNVSGVISPYSTTEDFVKKLSEFMKISKICSRDELDKCFAPEFYSSDGKTKRLVEDFKTSKIFAVEDWSTNAVGLQFGNGVNAILAYNPSCRGNQFSNSVDVFGCVSLIYDINGFGKPNRSTEDIRTINAYGLDNININGVHISKVLKSGSYQPIDCTDENNKDIEYCYGLTDYSSNYWAGAAKACGGQDKMASRNDLIEIAKYMYKDDSISDTKSGLTKDTARSAELESYGIPNANIYFWSSTLYTSGWQKGNSDVRNFANTSTYSGFVHPVSWSGFYALCVK